MMCVISYLILFFVNNTVERKIRKLGTGNLRIGKWQKWQKNQKSSLQLNCKLKIVKCKLKLENCKFGITNQELLILFRKIK
jgi:hypothetical protein